MMCGSPQPTLGVCTVAVGAGWEKRSHQGSQTWGSHAQFGELDHQRLEGHTWEKQKSPCVCPALTFFPFHPLWPLLEAQCGVRGIFPSQVKPWGCRGQCDEAFGRSSSPLLQQPLTPTAPAPQSPTPTAPPAQHWTFLTRCFLCDSALSGQ